MPKQSPLSQPRSRMAPGLVEAPGRTILVIELATASGTRAQNRLPSVQWLESHVTYHTTRRLSLAVYLLLHYTLPAGQNISYS